MAEAVCSLGTSVGNFGLLKVEFEIHLADDFTSWKVKKVSKIMKRVTCHHGSHCKRWIAEHRQTFALGNLTSQCWERTGAGGSNNGIFTVQPQIVSLRKMKGKHLQLKNHHDFWNLSDLNPLKRLSTKAVRSDLHMRMNLKEESALKKKGRIA